MSEKSGVVGLSSGDMATWWPGVKSEFDEQAPSPQEVVLSEDGRTIVALLFETDLAPFVVRNPAHGQPGGGPVALEVPWRETTSVRSAKRSDLLRLLLPTSALPSLTLHNATAEIWAEKEGGARLSITMAVYAVIPLGSAVVLPDHQTHGKFSLRETEISGDLDVGLEAKSWSQIPRFHDTRSRFRFEGPDESPLHTVHQGDQQIVLQGPGFFRFRGSYRWSETDHLSSGNLGPLEITFTTRPAGNDLSTGVQATLPLRIDRREGSGSNTLAQWQTS